jgi:hypothetical protein
MKWCGRVSALYMIIKSLLFLSWRKCTISWTLCPFSDILNPFNNLGLKLYDRCSDHLECPAHSTCRPSDCKGYSCLCIEGYVATDDKESCLKGKSTLKLNIYLWKSFYLAYPETFWLGFRQAFSKLNNDDSFYDQITVAISTSVELLSIQFFAFFFFFFFSFFVFFLNSSLPVE